MGMKGMGLMMVNVMNRVLRVYELGVKGVCFCAHYMF